MKKFIKVNIAILKIIYLVIGSSIIIPIAIIIAITQIIYNNAKTTIQTKTRKSNKRRSI